MSDAYLRTGRGGAGNFYSQKDVEDAVKRDRKEDDIEAQIPAVPARLDDNSTTPSGSAGTFPSSASSGGVGVYARSGRGGAGNFIPSSALPAAPSSPSSNNNTIRTDNSNTSTTPTTTTTSPPLSPSAAQQPKYSSSGRGGAGNWTTTAAAAGQMSEETRRAVADQETRRREALDKGIAQEIRDSLPQPPRTYHLHGPGRGRKPEV